MYHRIKPPTCVPELAQLLNLARLTIAFAIENDPTSVMGYQVIQPKQQAQLADRLSPAFLNRYGGVVFLDAVERAFIDYFEQRATRRAGEWLWGKYAVIAEPVVKLLVVSPRAKRRMLETFDSDVDLPNRMNAGSFDYLTLPSTSNAACRWVKVIMLGFYSKILVGKGVDADILGTDGPFSRATVLQAFKKANPHLNVCPGCDNALSYDIEDEDADHFFPKSKYPFLAIHPLNLTPFCKVCNQTYKKALDALQAEGVANLADIYHPYFRSARRHVRVLVRRDPITNNPTFKLKPKSRSEHHQERINSLAYVLDLPGRWQVALNNRDFDAKLISSMRKITDNERNTPDFSPNETFMGFKLGRAISNYMYDISKEPQTVPTCAYAQYVYRDAQARSKWIENTMPTLFPPKRVDRRIAQLEQRRQARA